MSLLRTALTAPSVEPSRPPRTDAGAFVRFARSQVSELPLAVCFPRDDAGFAERVQRLFEGPYSEPPLLAAVQALLRESYPLAVISPRHELAAFDGGLVWYAFRYGSAVPTIEGETP
jgi:hypothetical protein